MIIIPGIALMLGGFISSASDFTHNIRASLLRGALIGPFYGILLAILAIMSTSSLQASALGADIGVTLSASPISAFLNGVLWGALFGALGGWIQIAGRHTISAALPTMQATRSRWVGACAGAAIALVVGVSLTSALTAAILPLVATISRGTITTDSELVGLSASNSNNLPLLLMLAFAFLPAVASILFTVVAGAPYVSTTTSLVGTDGTSQTAQATSAGLIAAQSHPPLGLIYLVLLIPILSYLIGGRISARIIGATRADAAVVAGALIGLPSALLLAGTALLGSVTFDANALGVAAASSSASPSVFGALLAGLVGGTVFGAIGGLSEVILPSLGELPRILLLPLRPLGLALNPLLDAITGQPRGYKRGVARSWLYDAMLLAVVLIIIVIALNIVDRLPVAVLPFRTALIINAVMAALVITLPLFYFTGALVTLFSSPQNGVPIFSGSELPGVGAAPAQQPAVPNVLYPGMPVSDYPVYPGQMGYPTIPGQVGYPGSLSVPLPTQQANGGAMSMPPMSLVAPEPPNAPHSSDDETAAE